MRHAWVAALVLAGAAAAQERVTLRTAVDAVLTTNPAIAGAVAGTRVAEARVDEARASRLPRIDASGTLMRSNNPVFVFGSLLEQGRFGAQHFDPGFLNDPDPLTNDRLALNVRYTLFDQFRRRDLTAQAQNAVGQAAAGGEEARQRLRAETIARFYGALLAEEKRRVAAETVASAEADARSMRDRYEQGLLVESDLLGAEVQLASFRQRLIEAEGDAAIVRAALATLLRRPLDAPIEVSGSIPASASPLPPLDEAVADGVARRGELQIAKNATGNAGVQVRTARASRLPRADAFASAGASRGDTDHALGLVISVDLFDGGRRARIAQAQAGLEAARASEDAARDRVTMEIVTAWHRARAARERIAVADKSAERAAAASRIVRDRYDHGLTTITEHLRAQTALLAARLELLAARYDSVTGHAELLRSTGGLHDVNEFE